MKVNTNKKNEATSFTAQYAVDNKIEVHRYDGRWDVRYLRRQPADIGSCAKGEKQPRGEADINRGANSGKRKRDELYSTYMLAFVKKSIETLSPEIYLDDSIIEYCLAKGCEDEVARQSSFSLLKEWNFCALENRSNLSDFCVMKSFTVTKAEEKGEMKPIGKRKSRKESLDWRIGGCSGLCDFLLFPINFKNSHWSLGIVWQANEDEHQNKPGILYLDSWRDGLVDRDVEKKGEAIRKYLSSLSTKKFTKINLPLIHVEVPQQKNGYDCGMFLLHYAILFMMCDSKHALASELKEGNKKDWFDCEVPSNLRQSLKMAVVKELEALQKWRGVAETDDGGAT